MKPIERREIQFHQLCAIARTVLEANPTITDSEWKDRTLEKAAKQGYDEAPSDMLSRALTQVEHALIRTLGPRPIEGPPQPPETVKPQQHDPPWQRGKAPAGWKLVASLMANLNAVASAPRSGVSPVAHDYAIDEFDAINVFWAEVRAGANRIATLRAFAEVAIVRPAGWDPDEIRAHAAEHSLFAENCFGCGSGSRAFQWHHVIQIQHGGSNTFRNRVALCGACHADIHPWLEPQASPRRTPGWTRLAEACGALLALTKPKDKGAA